MTPVWVTWLASLAAFVAVQQAEPTPRPELPARRAVAGIAGFQSVSSVRYAEAPELDHELTCTYVFPARGRWQLWVPEQPQLGRHVEYRYGERFFELPQSAERSREVRRLPESASEWRAKCELHELRLALFLWPDGLEWKPDGAERRAKGECGRDLLAKLDAQGRPTQLSFAPELDRVDEELRVSSWREQRGRSWPADIEFWRAGQLVWKEHVAGVATQISLLDSYFLPPDRRSEATTQRVPSVLHFDAPAQTEAREFVTGVVSWSEAQARWDAFAVQIDGKLPAGWERLSTVAYELDHRGEVTAVIVRLRGRGTPPEFSSSTPACQALTTSIGWPAAELAPALRRLDDATPKEAKAVRRLVTLRGDQRAPDGADLTVLIEREH